MTVLPEHRDEASMTALGAAAGWRDWEPIFQQWSAIGVPVARDDVECAALDHPPSCSNHVSWPGGRTFCRCGQVSQPGLHGGSSALGYHLGATDDDWCYGLGRAA